MKILLVDTILLFVLMNVYSDTGERGIGGERHWCLIHKKKYNMQIGENWGSLPEEKQKEWINLECDKYFCQVP